MNPGGHTAQHLLMFLFECQDACSVSPPSVGGSGSSITDTEDQFQDFLAEKQPLIFVLSCKNRNKKLLCYCLMGNALSCYTNSLWGLY